MKQERQSNYELMRIVLMFMVVFWHMIVNIVFACNLTGTSEMLWKLLYFLFEIHIDTFILLTGYFQSKKKKIEASKLLKINNQAYFYKIIFLVIYLIFKITSINKIEIFWTIQPITLYYQYWYISIYLILLFISPFLNILLNKLSKREHFLFITGLFLLSSIIPTITKDLVFNSNKGFSILNFILLYSIGSYLRKHPIEESYLFSKIKKDSRKNIFLFAYIILAFLNLLVNYFQVPLNATNNSLMKEIATIINNMQLAYNNPILIFQAISFFLYFGELKIKSKIINFISTRTLDIYLIHDNYFLRKTIYHPIIIFLKDEVLNYKSFFAISILSIGIFISCFVIGLIRELLFKIINLFPVSKKINNKLQNKLQCILVSDNN